ncbi:MAG: hypothetical protein LBB50_04130 [Oscillospiraceae bacterium]|jgi:hypothetical protein|nr:hypothetical protein [Oscillospiraceae bacterium]
MNILYLITKMITYPGAFMKGFWEHCTCRILKIQVTDRRYLSSTKWCGHAAHAPALTPGKAFLLAWLPYFAQRVTGLIFLGASVGPLLVFNLRGQSDTSFFWLYVVFLFLGLSIICNSFPQWEDAKHQWQLFYGKPAALAEEVVFEAAEASEDEVVVVEAVEAEEESEEEVVEAADESDEAVEAAEAEEAVEAEEEAVVVEASERHAAGAGAKILLAPGNAWLLAGAWLEQHGLPTIVAVGLTIWLLAAHS